jgi:hypothetical protein
MPHKQIHTQTQTHLAGFSLVALAVPFHCAATPACIWARYLHLHPSLFDSRECNMLQRSARDAPVEWPTHNPTTERIPATVVCKSTSTAILNPKDLPWRRFMEDSTDESEMSIGNISLSPGKSSVIPPSGNLLWHG